MLLDFSTECVAALLVIFALLLSPVPPAVIAVVIFFCLTAVAFAVLRTISYYRLHLQRRAALRRAEQ